MNEDEINFCIGACYSYNFFKQENINQKMLETSKKEHLEGYTTASTKNLETILQENNMNYICGYVQSPCITAEQHHQLVINIQDNKYKMFIIQKRPELKPETINILSTDDNLLVRFLLAGRNDLTEEAYQNLSADPYQPTREQILINPNTPEEYKLIAALYRET